MRNRYDAGLGFIIPPRLVGSQLNASPNNLKNVAAGWVVRDLHQPLTSIDIRWKLAFYHPFQIFAHHRAVGYVAPSAEKRPVVMLVCVVMVMRMRAPRHVFGLIKATDRKKNI